MHSDRSDEEGIEWAARLIGGRVVHRERQIRWRPHWTLHIEDDDAVVHRVLLRGYRNPGYTETDAAGARRVLEREAGVLEAIQGVPIRIPRYYGYNSKLGWMLMEFIDGDVELTALQDKVRLRAIYRTYMEELATLHAYPITELKLPATVEIPASGREFRTNLLARYLGPSRALERAHPEPTTELALQWVINNDLPDERPVALGLGDVGPNQFLFEGDHLTSLIDFESAIVGDPLWDMGKMRGRNLLYHIDNMPDHLRYYGEVYERLTGIPLSLDSLQYWTVAGPALFQTQTLVGTQNPSATTVDAAFMFSYEVIAKRRVMEGLAEVFDLDLVKPEVGAEQSTTLGRLHALLIDQFAEWYGPSSASAEDRSFARYSGAIAETLALGDANHPAVRVR